MNHTPGPWTADFSSDSVRVRAPDGSGICTINWLSAKGRRDGYEGEANARMIAAAPTLFTAVEAMLDALAMEPLDIAALYGPEADPDTPLIDATRKAREAIKIAMLGERV